MYIIQLPLIWIHIFLDTSEARGILKNQNINLAMIAKQSAHLILYFYEVKASAYTVGASVTDKY